jgi:predicted PurR-regulated permease PerM
MQRRFLRITALLLIGLGGVAFFYYIRSLLIPFVIAALIAYVIYPLVRSLEMRGIKRRTAIFTVYAAGVVLVAIFFTVFIPALLQETRSFSRILPEYTRAWEEAQAHLYRLSERVYLPPEGRQVLREMTGQIRSGVLESLRGFARAVLGIISFLPSLILAPFLAYYLIRDFDHIKKRFLAALPPGYRSDLLSLIREGDLIFSQFLRGHLLISAIVGLLTGVGAALIGMPFAVLIGLFTAVADLVPVFGPVLAAVPVVGLALSISQWKAVLMLGIFLAVQQLEGSVLAPRLLGDRVGLHPLMVVFVLLVGGYLAGPLGLIFAVPAAGLLRVVLSYLWEKMVRT